MLRRIEREGAYGVRGKCMFGVGMLTSFVGLKQRMRGPFPRRKNQFSSGSPCGPIMWCFRKPTSLYLPSRQQGPRESVKMKKWLEPLLLWKAGLLAPSRCRHCCCAIAGPAAYCRANSTTTLALACRQSVVTNGLRSIM